jgi:hypothetical protein
MSALSLLQMLHIARTALLDTSGSLLLLMSRTSASTAPAPAACCLMAVLSPLQM